MTIRFLKGKHVYLQPLDRDAYCHAMMQWVNDDDATHFMLLGALPATQQTIEKSYDSIQAATDETVMAVIARENDTYIGNVGLYRIDRIALSAEYRIFLGHNAFRGKGLGTEAANLMISYAFDRLNFNKVWLGVNEINVAALKSYEKSGFVREGILRDEIYRNGRYYDAIRMSILRREYLANVDRS